jgi:hypothetical protein
MKEKSPVFIVGPGRSGTSLLYRMLQKHPVFEPQNCAAGVDLTESQVFSAPESICDKERTPGVGAYSYMLFKDETNQLYWEIDPYLFDEIHTKTKDWRVFVEQGEAEYIETTLKPQMKRLGYQRYTQEPWKKD